MQITAIAPWYGSNRMLAAHVGKLLKGCEWVGVPFCGGMSELAHIDARTLLVSDLHRHVINLARVVANTAARAELIARLEATPFHPDALRFAQEACGRLEPLVPEQLPPSWACAPDVGMAAHYFVCSWMARNGTAGTAREFDAGIATRWNAGGGDSAVRFRNATESLADWSKIMRRCTFVCLDVFDFLDKVHDQPGHGLYLDPPFPGPGDRYRHTFGEDVHRRLASRLCMFDQCRIVCRFYDVPLIRELYPEGPWIWHRLEGGRKQTNAEAPEVLLVRGGDLAA